NLVSNALEASSNGSRLTIRTRMARNWAGTGTPGVKITISDTGSGIPSDIKAQIFDAFFTTKQLGGSGLGLWVSMGIVNKHGGEIALRSSTQQGKSGSCFSVFLPMAVESSSSAPRTRSTAKNAAQAQPQRSA